jgi:hypothetical protein
VAGCFEHGDEPNGGFLRQLRNCFSKATLPRGVHLSDRFCPELKLWHVAVATFAATGARNAMLISEALCN